MSRPKIPVLLFIFILLPLSSVYNYKLGSLAGLLTSGSDSNYERQVSRNRQVPASSIDRNYVKDMVGRLREYIKKMVDELNSFDNKNKINGPDSEITITTTEGQITIKSTPAPSEPSEATTPETIITAEQLEKLNNNYNKTNSEDGGKILIETETMKQDCEGCANCCAEAKSEKPDNSNNIKKGSKQFTDGFLRTFAKLISVKDKVSPAIRSVKNKMFLDRLFSILSKSDTAKNDEEWTDWSNWSECSSTCGKGKQIRYRHCLNSYCDAKHEINEKICNGRSCGAIRNILRFI